MVGRVRLRPGARPWASPKADHARPGQFLKLAGQVGACLYFTDMVKCGEDSIKKHFEMKAERGNRKKMKAQSTAQVRASISFPPDVYKTLELIAKEKKVSLAWVVREAADKYIADKWPLLRGQGYG